MGAFDKGADDDAIAHFIKARTVHIANRHPAMKNGRACGDLIAIIAAQRNPKPLLGVLHQGRFAQPREPRRPDAGFRIPGPFDISPR